MQFGTAISDNVAVGENSLRNATGNDNTAIGTGAGIAVTSGVKNVYIGSDAGSDATDADNNVFIGYGTRNDNAGTSSQVVLGYQARSQGGGYFTVGNGASSWTRVDIGATTWYSSSDERLKKNVNNLNVGLNFINDLRPVTYNWKTKGEVDSSLPHYEENSTELVRNGDSAVGLQYGFIAQEIKQAVDTHNVENNGDVWAENNDGIQDIGTTGLIPMLVKALQEADDKIDALTARIDTLEG